MTRIPIDLTAPIACSAKGDELPIRIDQVDHLRERLLRIDRTTGGLLLHFEPDVDLGMHLENFVRDEKGCCQFWGFELSNLDHEITLAWDGPPDVQELLDELLRYFRSDEPLTAFSGLL